MTQPDGGMPARPSSNPTVDRGPIHVESQTFRRRRLVDAACSIPLLGWILWWLPLIWSGATSPVPASQALIYIFGVWIGLAVCAARLVNLLNRNGPLGPTDQGQGQ